MFAAYRQIYALPGAIAFSVSGFIMRLPMGIFAFAIISLIISEKDSYTLAGAMVGVFWLVNAFVVPQFARWADRRGQAKLILVVTAVHVLAEWMLVCCAFLNANTWYFLVAVTVMGATFLPVSSFVRSRWSFVAKDHIHTAYSLESVLEELIFFAGPVIAAVSITFIAPVAALLIASALSFCGGFALASQRSTEPPIKAAQSANRIAIRHSPGLLALAAACCALGGIFGSLQVLASSFADQHGRPGFGGVLIGLISVGAGVSGFFYGISERQGSLAKRYLIIISVLTASVAAERFINSLALMSVAMVFVGIAIAPALITGYRIAEQLAPDGLLTQSLTLSYTGISIGVGGGFWLAGRTVDSFAVHTVALVGASYGIAAIIIVATCQPLFRITSSLPTAVAH